MSTGLPKKLPIRSDPMDERKSRQALCTDVQAVLKQSNAK